MRFGLVIFTSKKINGRTYSLIIQFYLVPVTNVKPIVVKPKPQLTTSVSTVVNKCHVTMNCMTSCEHGYTLGNTGKDGCPLCTCIQPHTSKSIFIFSSTFYSTLGVGEGLLQILMKGCATGTWRTHLKAKP